MDGENLQTIRHSEALRNSAAGWEVEGTFAWIGRCRRLAKDWEKSIASSTAWTLIGSIRVLTRRTARHCQS